MKRIQRDEPAQQGKVLYPLQGMLRKIGIHVLKDMCLTREISHVPEKMAEGRATDLDRMGEVSRRHSSRRKRAPKRRGGLTPVKV